MLPFCHICGEMLRYGADCSKCGGNPVNFRKVNPTRLLWLVPLFGGLLGGILMYIAVKDHNQQMANRGMLVGSLLTIVIIIVVVLATVIYMSANIFGNLF